MKVTVPRVSSGSYDLISLGVLEIAWVVSSYKSMLNHDKKGSPDRMFTQILNELHLRCLAMNDAEIIVRWNPQKWLNSERGVF